jgi:hypothetical protein
MRKNSSTVCCHRPSSADTVRLRLRWRYLLIFMALGTGVVAFGLWRLSRDDERLTRWLVDSVQSATGLQMRTNGNGRFGFWPRLSIALDGVQLIASADSGTPVRIGSIRVQVPWASLFGRQLRVSAIDVEDVVLDAAAIDAWLASRRDQGPLPALRWPSLDAALNVRRLRYTQAGIDGGSQDTLLLHTLQLDRWQVNQPSRLYASFVVAALGPQPFRMELLCTPRQSRSSIAIEPCSARLEREGSATLALRGYLRHDDFARVESQLRIESQRLPQWISPAPMLIDDKPIDLALRLVGAFDGPLKVKLGGPLAEMNIEADVVLPFGWIEQVQSRSWNLLAENSIGYARVDRLRTADAEFDEVEWRNETAAESSAGLAASPAPANVRQRR